MNDLQGGIAIVGFVGTAPLKPHALHHHLPVETRVINDQHLEALQGHRLLPLQIGRAAVMVLWHGMHTASSKPRNHKPAMALGEQTGRRVIF